MRLLSTLVASSLFAITATATLAAPAPITDVSQVLGNCPVAAVSGCDAAVAAFVANTPAEAAPDAQLVVLVASLRGAALDPNFTPDMCVEIEKAIRVAGRAATTASVRSEIRATANGLCENDRPVQTFGSLSQPQGGFGGGAGGKTVGNSGNGGATGTGSGGTTNPAGNSHGSNPSGHGDGDGFSIPEIVKK